MFTELGLSSGKKGEDVLLNSPVIKVKPNGNIL